MRQYLWSLSTWDRILQNWDDRYVRELGSLGYISPLATILHRAFSQEHSLYGADLLTNLFTNQNIWAYNISQLQSFKSDLDKFSRWWLDDKEKGKELLQILRKELFWEPFLAHATFSSYWLGDGINHHILGVLDARVKQWIAMKSSSESNLFHNFTS